MFCSKCGYEYFDGAGKCPQCEETNPNKVSQKKQKSKKGCLIAAVAIPLFLVVVFFGSAFIAAIFTPRVEPETDVSGNVITTVAPAKTKKPTKPHKAEKPAAAPTTAAPETIKITARELLDAYDANEVKADNLYKGKLLEVTGIVNTIGKDVLDRTYVTLGAGDKYSLISVQCYIEKDSFDKAAELLVGDKVTILGTCSGGTLNVAIKKCVIK